MTRLRKVLMVPVLVFALGTAGAAAAEGTAPKASDSGAAEKQAAPKANPALLDPSLAKETAPDKFRAKFETTKGDFVVEVVREWSPNGADRFYNLVKDGFFRNVAFFRVIDGFMVQFGISGNPAVSAKWENATIQDDPVKQSNRRGFITYAKTNAPNSRTTQLFINFKDNPRLDSMGFSPFGKVVEGMDVVDALHKTGEGAPRGPGPNQFQIQKLGNAFLKEKFPEIDYIRSATLID